MAISPSIDKMFRRRLGPAQSPVVSATLSKKRKQSMIRRAKRGALRSVLALTFVLLDRYFLVTEFFFSGVFLVLFSYLEFMLLAVLLLNLLYDSVLCLTALMTTSGIKLTSLQRKLLGVTEKASGYVSVPSPTPFGDCLSPIPAPVHQTPPLHYLTPTSSTHSSFYDTPQSGSFVGSHTPTPSSWHSHSFTKLKGSSPYNSGRISDSNSLEKFLQYEQDKESVLLFSNPGFGGSPVNQFGSDFALTPRKYHLSTRSLSPNLREGDSSLCSDSKAMLYNLNKLGINKDNLPVWTDRCRRWLAERVVCPVAREIENINAVLRKSHDLQLGSVTLPKLQQIAPAKSHLVPTLSLLVPYLELSTKQDYLVSRILELSKGNNLSAFHWNSGGLWRERPWEQSLPNDSQIIMHLFCSYLDSQYPPNPQYPTDGKAFSSQYFIKTLDKSNTTKVDVRLYQESANPPEYKVLFREKCIELSKGRNNLFIAIAVFIHCIKSNKSSLGPVHLDKSGINAVWIIEN